MNLSTMTVGLVAQELGLTVNRGSRFIGNSLKTLSVAQLADALGLPEPPDSPYSDAYLPTLSLDLLKEALGLLRRKRTMRTQEERRLRGELKRISIAGGNYLRILGDDAGRQEIVHIVEIAEEALHEEELTPMSKDLQEGTSKSSSKERPTVQRPSRNPPSQKTPREVDRLREAAKAAAAMISAACTTFVREGGVIKTPEEALQTLLDALGGEDQMEIDMLRKAILTAGFALRGNKAPDLALKILIEALDERK